MIERIKQIIDHYNMSINAFAQKIGANQVTLNQQMNGDRKISLDTVLKIVNSFELISTDWLLTGRGNMFYDVSPKDGTFEDLVKTNKNLSDAVKNLSSSLDNISKQFVP